MKKQLYFLLFIASFLQCKVETADFEINAEQWAGTGNINRLIVTKRCGDIVKIFDNPAETDKLNERFPVKFNNSEDQTLDFHWIIGSSAGDYVTVLSSLGVHSGDYVIMRAGGSSINYQPETRDVVLFVDGIPPQGSGWDLEIPGVDTWSLYLPNNGDLALKVYLEKSQSLYLRVKPIGSQNWLEFFVPDSLIQDMMFTTVSDFKNAAPWTPLEVVGVNPSAIVSLYVTEFSADLNHFTVLKTSPGFFPQPSQHPAFILPPDHSLPSTFRLAATSNQNNKGWSIDKILPSGAPLRLEKPDMFVLEKFHNPGKGIGVFVAGRPDIISTSYYINEPGRVFGWHIEAGPEYLLEYELPEIFAYLPPWVDRQKVFCEMYVVATRFDNLDLEQIRAGLPDKSPEQYAFAKSGMLRIWE